MILQNKEYLHNMVCMIFVWISSSFGFYLINYQLKYIKGDMYLNSLVSSTSGVVAYCISGVLFEKVGLKFTFIIAYAIALLGMLSLMYYQGDEKLMICIFVLGSKFGVSLVGNVAYLANYRLFPGKILTTTFGICNVFAKVFTIIAPYVAELKPDSIS